MSASALRRLHGALALFWTAMAPVSAVTPLRSSVPYLVMLSVLALALSEFGAWQSARAEDAADDAEAVASRVLEMLRQERPWDDG